MLLLRRAVRRMVVHFTELPTEGRVMPLDKNETKEAVKEALKEWLDDKYRAFGKWSLHGMMAMMLVVIVYLFMIQNGWYK